jgi:hypothetical protein
MSFASLPYDPCAYSKSLKESLAVGGYMLDEKSTIPALSAFPRSPYVRLDKTGVSTCENVALIDVDSELLGLYRPATKCPPCDFNNDFCKTSPMADGDDFLAPEETKMSNPPCTLRGTGWNRWEWLCTDPQEKALMDFETNIQNKLVVRDNHRPCVPNPMAQDGVHPRNADDECYTDKDVSYVFESNEAPRPPLMHWRKCCEVSLL